MYSRDMDKQLSIAEEERAALDAFRLRHTADARPRYAIRDALDCAVRVRDQLRHLGWL